MTNVIGDIAGNYKTLMALLKKMPDEEVVSVGDMVDRGPRSKEVVEWFMKNGKAILGNHEHMMIDHTERSMFYEEGTWTWNGGDKTLESYGYFIPPSHIEWMKGLPLYMEIEGAFVAHSFLKPADIDDEVVLRDSLKFGISSDDPLLDASVIWNRREPVRRKKWDVQIAGHNSQFGLREWRDDKGVYAYCIDSSRDKVLTGIHLPSYTIYQQEYID